MNGLSRVAVIAVYCLAASLASMAPAIAASFWPDSTVCYVWEFSDENGKRSKTTETLTREFNDAFTRLHVCTVLERRELSRLLEQKQNERIVHRIQGLSEESQRVL